MKLIKWLIALGCLSSWSYAADITYNTNSPNFQLYNSGIRDVKDGTNAPTVDVVSASTYSVVNTTTIVKASAGYISGVLVTNLQVPNLCSNPLPVKILNTASAPAAGTQQVVAISSSAAMSAYLPVNARVDTGITVGIDGTCVPIPTVEVYYR